MAQTVYQTLQDIITQLGFNTPADLLNVNPTTPTNPNHLTNNKFRFYIKRCPTVTYFCQRANIPALSFGTSVQANPTGISLRRPGTSYTYEDLQVGFIVNEDMTNWLEIHNWIKDLGVGYNGHSEIIEEAQKDSSAMLLVTNSKYKPSLCISFHNIYPTFLSGIDFDSAQTDTDSVVSTCTFAYSYYTIDVLTNP